MRYRAFNSTDMKSLPPLILCILMLLVGAQGYAQITLSTPDSTTTKVMVGIHIIDISRVTDIEQNFTIDFALRLGWKDPRLAHEPGIYELNEVWHPAVLILNQHGMNKLFDDVIRVDEDGNVWYTQRYYGDLALKLTLHDFPFDTHKFPITVASRYYTPDEVQFVPIEDGISIADELSVSGWVFDREVHARSAAYRIAAGRIELSEIDYELKADREADFYVWRVIVPLILIIFMSWAVFYIDPKELEPQISISVSAILSVIALQFTFVAILPKVSYLTRLDKFILGATIMIFLALVESVTTSALTIKNKHTVAQKVDLWSRIIFPIGLILLSMFALFI